MDINNYKDIINNLNRICNIKNYKYNYILITIIFLVILYYIKNKY